MTIKDFIIRLALNIFYIPLFFIFSYLIPKDKKLILIGSGFGHRIMGNPRYFYLWLCQQQKVFFKFSWITRNKELFRKLRKDGIPVVFLYSLKGMWYIIRANYFIIEQSSQDITGRTFLLGNFNIINTWHGTFVKNDSFEKLKKKSLGNKLFHSLMKKEKKNYKLILACSKSAALNLQFALFNKNIKITGYPRNDIFFNRNLSFRNYRKELNLDKYSKVLLYAPTFRDGQNLTSPFSEEFSIELNNHLKKNNYVFLIKNHPSFEHKIKVFELSNILNISNSIDDIQEILIHADVLITDYSSMFFEFCLTNRPIIFYPYDYDSYLKNCREMYYDYYKEMPGPFANNQEELLDLIKSVNQWSRDEDYKRRYELFKNRFNQYQDGKSCERLYGLIREIL
ncbi:CDP-glycerol glycerophosphotransferase family protein [Candidatus Parcubacteria bacterium]|nr:CDP-glycerol glycerophosphotransferase family protein [Candidatus Parcubacteria bacterium]